MISAGHEAEPQAPPSPRLRPPVRRIAIWAPLIVVLLLALGLTFGILRHIQQQRDRSEFSRRMGQVVVEVVTIKRDGRPHELNLPGNIVAAQETTIFARASGYVARWTVDIGDKVKEGRLLVEIETPELEQELAQAQGALRQAQSDFELARATARRWEMLAVRGVVSRQENDEKQSAYRASAGTRAAAAANVSRLEKLQGFRRVTAPFSGTITARKVDIGALVSAGGGTAGTPLFSLAQTDPLDIYINVPQTDVIAIREGLSALIRVPELPDRRFEGEVVRTAGALDPASRTLLTEVQIPNKDNALYAGMYAEVSLTIRNENAPLLIPANTFVFRVEGPQAAVVTRDNKIHWQTLRIGRDFGTRLEVLSGLEENARLVVNPTDDLRDGMAVETRETEQPAVPESRDTRRSTD